MDVEKMLTTSLQMAEAGEILDLLAKKIVIDRLDKDDCENFDSEKEYEEHEAEWNKFVEETDHLGTYHIAKYLTTYDISGKIEDTSCVKTGGSIRITFNEPIKARTGYSVKNGKKESVISEITALDLDLSYEWSWKKGSKSNADMIDIYGTVTDFN